MRTGRHFSVSLQLLSYGLPLPTEQEVRFYARPDGIEPFSLWFDSLRDRETRDRVLQRLARIHLGNFGDFRSVGVGVQELRIPVGPGIRIYFVRLSGTVVILPCGGDKHSQRRDIRRAQLYWKEYRSRPHDQA